MRIVRVGLRRLNRMQRETSTGHRSDHVVPHHQLRHIAGGQHDTVVTRQATRLAQVETALGLRVHVDRVIDGQLHRGPVARAQSRAGAGTVQLSEPENCSRLLALRGNHP